MKKLLLISFFLLNLSFQSKAQATVTLTAAVYGWGGSSAYYLDSVIAEVGGGCNAFGHPTGPAIMVAILDSCLRPWSNKNVNHGHWNYYCVWPVCSPDTFVCRMREENYFIYSFNNPASFTRLHEWIRDSVPDGQYILIYSWTTYWWSNVPAELNNLMTDLGNTSWPPSDSVPFIYAVKKGFTSELDTMVQGSNWNDSVFLELAIQTNCPVGIPEINYSDNAFLISPNPANDFFSVNRTGRIKIYDSLGREVLEQRVNPSSQVDCKGFSKGIYYVKMMEAGRSFSQKLLIE
jgi:hypothetical protein